MSFPGFVPSPFSMMLHTTGKVEIQPLRSPSAVGGAASGAVRIGSAGVNYIHDDTPSVRITRHHQFMNLRALLDMI